MTVEPGCGTLGAHVMDHEISGEGPVRESYLAGRVNADDHDRWETEIGWPIDRSDSKLINSDHR